VTLGEAGNSLVGAGTLTLSSFDDGQVVNVDLCWRRAGTAPLVAFGGDDAPDHPVGFAWRPYPVAAATVLAAGTYDVGACVRNPGTTGLFGNGNATTWVRVH
jgi:hypothetical protein